MEAHRCDEIRVLELPQAAKLAQVPQTDRAAREDEASGTSSEGAIRGEYLGSDKVVAHGTLAWWEVIQQSEFNSASGCEDAGGSRRRKPGGFAPGQSTDEGTMRRVSYTPLQ